MYASGWDDGLGDRCTISQDPSTGTIPMVDDFSQPDLRAPEGRAEWYAESVDVTDPDANLLPLVYFVERTALRGFDRIHVAPNHRLTGMTIDLVPGPALGVGSYDDLPPVGECAEVRSRYEVDDGTETVMVIVTEVFGCAVANRFVENPALLDADDPGDLVGVEVGEDGEFVGVSGPTDAVEEVRADLVRAPFERLR